MIPLFVRKSVSVVTLVASQRMLPEVRIRQFLLPLPLLLTSRQLLSQPKSFLHLSHLCDLPSNGDHF